MKFKGLTKKVYIKKSPRISRSITEYFKFSFPKINSVQLIKLYRSTLKFFVVFIFLVAVIIVGYDLQNNLQIKKAIESQRENLAKELNFWENFIAKNQNYPDAYFQASILEYRLGNIAKAKTYVEKGISLNPNSENGKKIDEFLKNKFYF